MANEIQVTATLRVANGNFRHQSDIGQVSYDQAVGSGGAPGIVSASTTSAAVSFGAVTPGYVWLRNLSTGTSIHVDTTSNLNIGRYPAGRVGLFMKGTGGIKVRTTSGTALIDVRGYST